jgi:N-acetylneuraminic acid mutarotase
VSINSFRSRPARAWGIVAVAGLVLAVAPASVPAHAASAAIMVSSSPTRSAAVPLQATTRSGALYVFTTPDTAVSKVSFWLDNPSRTGAPVHIENTAPFTFTGDTASGSNPWDSTKVVNGSHTITAQLVIGGNSVVVSATFNVFNANQPPPASYVLQVSTKADRSAPIPLAGSTVAGPAFVFVPASPGITRVAFFVDDALRSKLPYHVENSGPWDLAGTAVSLGANPWQTGALPDGPHVLSADVTGPSGVSHLNASFTVSQGGTVIGATNFSYAPIAGMPIGTTEAESIVVNDKLYLFGGFDVIHACCTPTDRAWVYDPVTNTWTALPSMPAQGTSHAGIGTDGVRYIYYAGGYAADPAGIDHVSATALAWRYDIDTGTYTALPPLPAERTAGGMAWVSGSLYYFGGNGLDRTVDSPDVWMLDVANGGTSWVSRANLPNPRDHIGWGVIDGKIYAVGGEYSTDANKAQSELDRYDPASDSWTVLAPLPVARSHDMDSTFLLSGQLVVAGGWTSTAVTGAVTAYNPATNTWRTLTDLPEPRTSATAKSLSDGRYLYCCGSASTSTSTGWMATPTP